MNTLPRQKVWIQNYRSRPYLQHSSEQEIAKRLRYTLENLTTIAPNGKLSTLPPEPNGKFWYELFEHALEEYRRRGIQPPAQFLKGAQIPNPAHPAVRSALQAMSRIRMPRDRTYLVKMGRREHIANLYQKGILRIAPASSYSDPSLNAAIRDDELTLSAFGQKSEVRIHAIDPETGAKHSIEPIGNLTYTSRSKSNYYVQCLTSRIDARLFVDFGYDACLIIFDHEEFERRLAAAVRSRLPEWLGAAGPVSYLDPFNSKRDDMNVFVGKHLKYSYQHEYRFFWLPRPPLVVQALDPFYVELGSLREIAQLAILDEHS